MTHDRDADGNQTMDQFGHFLSALEFHRLSAAFFQQAPR